MALKLPKLPQLPFRLPNLGPRTRRVLRYVGLAVFALFVFVIALQMTIPYARAVDKFVVEGMADKYEITIGSVERGWIPGRVYLKSVSFRSRPSKPEETVTTFFINELKVDVGLLALIGQKIDVDFDAKIGVGHLAGNVTLEKFGQGSIAANVTGDSLPAASLPMRAALGLPMTGKIQFSVDISLPVEKSKMGRSSINWQKVAGVFNLSCPSGCTFGDGKTKLKPLLKNTRNQVMVGEGIDFGKVNLDSLVARATIKKGKLNLDKFDAKSKDGELKVDYAMTLEKEFGESMVAGCLRFKGSDDLLRREPKTHAAISTTGAELRGDGLFHIRLSDRFKDMKRLNQECGPNTNTNANGENFSGNSGNNRPQPNLTVQPDEAAKPTGGSNTPTFTPPTDTTHNDAGTATPPTPMPAYAPATNESPTGSGSGPGSGEALKDGQRERPPSAPAVENPTGSAPSPSPPPEN